MNLMDFLGGRIKPKGSIIVLSETLSEPLEE
jgi:hypothetical protein